MSKPRMPYQCLKQCGNLLVAARGSSIDIFDIKDGSYLSTWMPPISESPEILTHVGEDMNGNDSQQKSQTSSPDIILDAATPPAKRRKLSVGEEIGTTTVVQQGKKNAKNNTPASKVSEPSSVTNLTTTNDRRHVIAVTGEDKAIRVFEWENSAGCSLKQLSERCMPKRPCAVITTADNSTIISADKFGDVYSLPLIPSDSRSAPPTIEGSASPAPMSEKQPPKLFQPTASNLTVHSIRNLKALEAQKKQTNKTSEKAGPTFEHKLLLGHVSMLTDVAVATANGHSYILTADRDEHIRITRGIPQTHIIEGFCLGHKEFVSRLCIPSCRPEILISGGGDDDLHVWDWVSGALLFKADLKGHVEDISSESCNVKDTTTAEAHKIAVTGIYHCRAGHSGRDLVIATCEGLPACIIYTLTAEAHLTHLQTLPLSGNALSVVLSYTTDSKISLIVSIDSVHAPWSTTAARESNETSINPLQFYRFDEPEGRFMNEEQNGFVTVGSEGFVEEGKIDRWKTLLYGVGNLRKMDGEEEP
ncbi:tRNA (guanine-N(7)-)-methyltransferase non-catalytic subunit trm82 [Clarireedia jacksonii]